MAKGERTTDLSELGKNLLALSKKQAQLRSYVSEYLTRGATMGYISRETGLNVVRLRRFLDNQGIIGSGQGLTRLCRLLDRSSLGEQITTLEKQIDDRYLGFASRSEFAITTAMVVTRAHRHYSENFTVAQFAAAFGELAETVEGILICSHDAIAQLEDEKTRQTIATKLDELNINLAAVRADIEAQKLELDQKLEQLLEPLLAGYGSVEALANKLRVHSSTIHKARRAESSLGKKQNLLHKLEQLEPDLPTPSRAAPKSRKTTAKSGGREASTSIPTEIANLGGATVNGVSYVLTDQSFAQIERVPLVALRESLRTALRVARLQLNIGSQLSDETAREILQKELGPEIQELELAIRTFTFAHPNQLLEIYESQRQHWNAQKKGKK